MNTLPLAPFLITLAADGLRVTLHDYARLSLALRAAGPWTLPRLRGVLLALLVRDAEQEETFLRRFDSFFAADLDPEHRFAEIDLDRALADLQQLAQEPPALVKPDTPRTKRSGALQPPPPPQRRPWRVVGLLALLFLSLTLGGDRLPLPPVPPEPQPIEIPPPPPPPPPPLPLHTLTDELTFVPALWKTPTQLAAVCLLMALLYSLWLWRSRRLPQDPAPPYDPSAPRRFRLGALGGKPAPWLDAAVLDRLADALGYFQSEQAGDRLNVPASIEATVRQGAIPSLVFQRRKQIRQVLILEDARASALAWNPVARELAAGLAQRGIPVLFGVCDGPPERFRTPEGTVLPLADLEDARQAYCLLCFSDSKSLQPQRDALLLETLARWPMVAWLELREPRAWDESTVLVARAGLPIYPATGAGLLQALGRHLSEYGAPPARTLEAAAWRGLPAYGGTDLAGHLEYLLGDALPWAQACAMLQPVSLGLADALRRSFCPALPPERVERLFALPGTTRSTAGLHFARPVLAVLRRGFTVRWEPEQQEAILRFLLAQMQQIKPAEPVQSLAYLTWEWHLERVRLELDPAPALQRLAALAQTGLGNAIRAELETCVLPDTPAAEPTDIPLRVRPRGKDALQRLARLAERSGVPVLEAYPVARWQWACLVLLLLGCVGFAGVGAARYATGMPPRQFTMTFVRVPAGTFMMGADDGDEDERPAHQVTISKAFYLGIYEVTQAQWEAVMGKNPGRFTGDPQRPVESVSWDDVQEFVRRLNTTAGSARYRLPTEAEWEYAARAGTTTAYSFGDDPRQLGDYAWYGENAKNETHAVGTKQANPWGLYDMHGNVWEWVQDWYGDYDATAVTDPQGPAAGSGRVVRGGGWYGVARYCRSANRGDDAPDFRGDVLGLRLLRTAP